MTTPFQPVLPVEGSMTDAEITFTEDSPPGLFAENQNSNIGLIRRILTNRVQELIGQQSEIYNERFVDTSTDFIDEWERQMGLPVAPTGRTLAQRRQDVLSRLVRGPFTRARRTEIVEKYIVATFGDPIQLTPAGVALTVSGLPLYTEAGSLATLYNIVEDIPNFHYQVRIKNTLTPDTVGLTRELTRVTPAHYSFDIAFVATP
jgi:hypothetical protein